MKLKSLGLIVASVVLTAVFYGCTTPPGVASDPGLGSFTRDTGHTPGNECQWSFDREGASKKIKNLGLDVNNGSCSVVSSSPIFIGFTANQGYEVKKLDGSIDLIHLGGSCKYCYLNSAGGMSCVTYTGNC